MCLLPWFPTFIRYCPKREGLAEDKVVPTFILPLIISSGQSVSRFISSHPDLVYCFSGRGLSSFSCLCDCRSRMKRLIVDVTSHFNIRCNDSVFPWGLFWFAKIWVRGALAEVYTGAIIQRRGYKVIEFTPINKQKDTPTHLIAMCPSSAPQATFSQLVRIG